MKILILYSDWKWTGPAEPILNLCIGLHKKGHTVTLACYPPPTHYHGRNLMAQAQAQGLKVQPLRAPKPFLFISDGLGNIRRLTHLMRSHPVDLIHSHSLKDQSLAYLIARRLRPKPVCIWTNHQGQPLVRNLLISYLLKHIDGYITLSPNLLKADQSLYHLSPDKTCYLESTIDLVRFNPQGISGEMRRRLGLAKDDLIAGVVARVQRHRRFDVLLKAVKIVVQKLPRFKLIVIGRGTHRREIAIASAQQMGLASHIIFTGYRTDDYVDLLGILDFGIYLVPGSDGSCRAVREIMALAKPLVVARRGILPEIIEDGVTGLVIDDTPENLAAAIWRLAQDKSLIQRLGENAQAKALKDFSPDPRVAKLEWFYHELVAKAQIFR